MSTDRELLELAAKAAGYPWRGFSAYGEPMLEQDMSKPEPRLFCPKVWNPITDDGDAFRLMVDLRLIVTQYSGGVTAYQCGPVLAYVGYDKHSGDRRAAVRYAIVRAAAALQQHKEGGAEQ